jgi:hypothetical protein
VKLQTNQDQSYNQKLISTALLLEQILIVYPFTAHDEVSNFRSAGLGLFGLLGGVKIVSQ